MGTVYCDSCQTLFFAEGLVPRGERLCPGCSAPPSFRGGAPARPERTRQKQRYPVLWGLIIAPFRNLAQALDKHLRRRPKHW